MSATLRASAMTVGSCKTTAIEWWIRRDEKLWCRSNQSTGLSHADKGTKKFMQCLVNAMASVGPLPIKCHEPTVMALARSANSPGIQEVCGGYHSHHHHGDNQAMCPNTSMGYVVAKRDANYRTDWKEQIKQNGNFG
ncbi:hypothetical protein B0H17DRAFT_1135706 [Mycena rosella]|uniref:Uncharacterized protein n=1 Tax=Mycena rosella TaxID=1033263 RepID=A0AAD7DCF8_MYCRO|nr:hypothetical protein B0H17DRAFT_1135706 [Mycena rosella]